MKQAREGNGLRGQMRAPDVCKGGAAGKEYGGEEPDCLWVFTKYISLQTTEFWWLQLLIIHKEWVDLYFEMKMKLKFLQDI